MNRTVLVLLTAASFLTSCTSYSDDVGTICDSPTRIGDTSKMAPSEKMELIGKYCADNVKSEKGKELLYMLSAAGRGKRNKIIRGEALKVNINPCYLADIP